MALTNFEIPEDLKLEFKIATAKNKTSMTAELLKFIRNYVGRQTRKTA